MFSLLSVRHLSTFNYRISSHISHILRSENEPKTRGATYMRDTIIMEANGQQFLDIQAKLWVRLIMRVRPICEDIW